MKYNTLLLVALLALGVGVVVVVGAGEEDPDEGQPTRRRPVFGYEGLNQPARIIILKPSKPRVPLQSADEHSKYLFMDKADSTKFWWTQYPEINEPQFLAKYITQTGELLKWTDNAASKEQLQMLLAVQAKGRRTFTDGYGDPHEMEGRTLSCKFLFDELNLLRDEVHNLYDEENRPYLQFRYPRLSQKTAEKDATFR